MEILDLVYVGLVEKHNKNTTFLDLLTLTRYNGIVFKRRKCKDLARERPKSLHFEKKGVVHCTEEKIERQAIYFQKYFPLGVVWMRLISGSNYQS